MCVDVAYSSNSLISLQLRRQCPFVWRTLQTIWKARLLKRVHESKLLGLFRVTGT